MWVPLPPHMSYLLYSLGAVFLGDSKLLGDSKSIFYTLPAAEGLACSWDSMHIRMIKLTFPVLPTWFPQCQHFLPPFIYLSIHLFIQELKLLSCVDTVLGKSPCPQRADTPERERHRPACLHSTLPGSGWYRRQMKIKTCEGLNVILFPVGKGMFPVHYWDKSSLKRWHLIIFKVTCIFVNISESTEEHNVLPKPPFGNQSIPNTLSFVFMFKCTDLYPTL